MNAFMSQVPIRRSLPIPAWRPARVISRPRLSQSVEPGEPTGYVRSVNLGIAVGGVIAGIALWNVRDTPIGSIAFEAAGGAAGVGLAFLLMDLLGARPA